MAVNQNPFLRWEEIRRTSDYRSKETQASSLTRQMLSQAEYLRKENRVNPGPMRNLRAGIADSVEQVPHNAANEDIWGWQPWADSAYNLSESEYADLLERDSGYCEPFRGDYDNPSPLPAPVITSHQRPGTFEFRQIQPLAIWTITHNLGFFPSVELLNSSRSEVDGDVIHVNRNSLRVEFTSPISGYARLN